MVASGPDTILILGDTNSCLSTTDHCNRYYRNAGCDLFFMFAEKNVELC
jgi:hypothetical protein